MTERAPSIKGFRVVKEPTAHWVICSACGHMDLVFGDGWQLDARHLAATHSKEDCPESMTIDKE